MAFFIQFVVYFLMISAPLNAQSTGSTVTKSCDGAECQSQTNTLQKFLSTCLKTKDQVNIIYNKLNEKGIDYDILYQLPADDIRLTFNHFGIEMWQTGLIISKLYDTEGSAVQRQSTSVVVLNSKQNKYILQLNKNIDNVKHIHLNYTVDNIVSDINKYYKQLLDIIAAQKTESLKTVDMIRNRKIDLLNNQTLNLTKTLDYLQQSDKKLNQIVNDPKLDLAKKQYAITQLIRHSQESLIKYHIYMQNNMRLITEPNIKYQPKDQALIKEYLSNIDNIIDVDIHFSEIKFSEYKIQLQWMSNLIQLNQNVTYRLQFKLTDNEQWDLLQSLSSTQKDVYLTAQNYEVLEPKTLYEFRIEAIFLENKIYSEILKANSNTQILHSILITNKERDQLLEWFPNGMKQQFTLLFRGSRDGFESSTFHQKSDNKGPTLVIVQSELNHVFGGYTSKSWISKESWVADDQAWIYLLRSSRNDQSQKWMIKKDKIQHAIYDGKSYGPTFGSGHDLYLSTECNMNANSYSNSGHSYAAPSDNKKLAGSYKFKVIDYEVWKLI